MAEEKKDMTIKEIIDLTHSKPINVIAKELLPCGEKKAREILTSLGAERPLSGKRGWDYGIISAEDLQKSITEFLTKKSNGKTQAKSKRTSERKKKNAKVEKNNNTNEEKNDMIKEQKHEVTKVEKEENAIETTNEVTVVRKRASFDIESNLLKELKIYAITEEKNVYEIVENAIRLYLQERK